MIHISDSIRNNNAYDGNTMKFGVTLDGVHYIVKFPKGDDLSVYCEYIASALIRHLEVPCHEVLLGEYNAQVVDVIRDFTYETGMMLHAFKETKQSSEDTDIGDKQYTYDDVLYLIDKHLKLSPEDKILARQMFWKMYLCDAVCANRDRHWGNWGYLSDGTRYRPAPLYDNGACLFPNVNRSIEGYLTDRRTFLYERVYHFPASLLMIKKEDRVYRTNYADILQHPDFAGELSALKTRMKHQFTPSDIRTFMSGLVSDKDIAVSEEIKHFFTDIVTLRYSCLIWDIPFDEAYAFMEKEAL